MIGPPPPPPEATDFAGQPMRPLGRRTWLLACVGVGALCLAGVSGRWWPTPDSAIYLGLGRSIAAGEGYTFNGEVNRTFPPGLPLVLAALRSIGGDGCWAPNAFLALCGLGGLWLAWRALRLAGVSPRMSLAVMLVCGLSYTFYVNSHRVLSDVPFCLVFWAMTCCLLRRLRGGGWGWLAAAGLLSAAGMCLRVAALLAVAAVAVGVVLDPSPSPAAEAPPRGTGPRSPTLGGRALAAAAVFAPAAAVGGLLYLLVTRLSRAAPAYERIVTGGLAAHPERLIARLRNGVMELPSGLAETLTSQAVWVLGMILAVPVLLGMGRLLARGRRLIPATSGLYVLGLVLCLGSFGIRPRYFLVLQPFLVYMGLLGVCVIAESVARWLRRPLGARARLAVLISATVALIGANAPRLAKHAFLWSVLSRSDRLYEKFRDAREADLFRAAELLARQCPPGGRAAVEQDAEPIVHYLSLRPTTPLSGFRRLRDANAEAVFRSILAAGGPEIILVEDAAESKSTRPRALAATGPMSARDRFLAELKADPSWRLLKPGRYSVYQRAP